MQPKEKCALLRSVRRELALENGIAYMVEDCRFAGACSGSCPKSEAEKQYLAMELTRRRMQGYSIRMTDVAEEILELLSVCGIAQREETAPAEEDGSDIKEVWKKLLTAALDEDESADNAGIDAQDDDGVFY